MSLAGGGTATLGALALPAAAMMLALVFCLTRSIVDFRARRIGWGLASLAAAGLLLAGLLVPIPTHAVKIELPVNDGS